MERGFYDAWQGLLAFARPTEPSDEWATILPVDEKTCVLCYPDGNKGTVVFDNGEWHFVDAKSLNAVHT